MTGRRKRLGEMLLENGLVSEEQLEKAIEMQQEDKLPLGQILVRAGLVSEKNLLIFLAAQQDVPPWHLEDEQPDADAVALLRPEICRQYQVLPVRLLPDRLILAMRNPSDFYAIEFVQNAVKLPVEPVMADEQRINRVIDEAYAERSVRTDHVDDLVEQALRDYKTTRNVLEVERQVIDSEEETLPVISLVNQILSDAIRMGASDIHIEPRYEQLEVRYRVDGEMLKVREIPKALTPMVTTRIKIMAEMDIVEYRLPQDGRISIELPDRTVDLRINTMPNYYGQRIVMRILDRKTALKDLGDLGFSDHNLALFRAMIRKPYGMVLVTGPTGSGKSTSLYSALAEIRNTTNNILTCEDPVEYEIPGISQSQINEKVGLTFAQLLRAAMRQDPDIILVGEIRDHETVETALRAALTGHLMLSTLHCNDAPSAIPRLLDMKADSFLLSTCLIGCTAQRLLRRLCVHCREAYEDPEALELIRLVTGEDFTGPLFRPVGCPRCYGTGYRGRMGIHEILPISSEVAEAIMIHEPVSVIRKVAGKYGYIPMQFDAMQRVTSGQTSIEEARRVVFFDTTRIDVSSASTPNLEVV